MCAVYIWVNMLLHEFQHERTTLWSQFSPVSFTQFWGDQTYLLVRFVFKVLCIVFHLIIPWWDGESQWICILVFLWGSTWIRLTELRKLIHNVGKSFSCPWSKSKWKKKKNKVNQTPVFISFCLLTVDAVWVASSCSDNHGFPSIMDCTFTMWALISPPFLQLLSSAVLSQQQDKATNTHRLAQ